MKFSAFEKVLTLLVDEKAVQTAYLDRLPTEFQLALFDNDYSDSLSRVESALSKELFTIPFLYDDVGWFLYEWSPGYSITVGPITYPLDGLSDYLAYVKENYEFEADNE